MPVGVSNDPSSFLSYGATKPLGPKNAAVLPPPSPRFAPG